MEESKKTGAHRGVCRKCGKGVAEWHGPSSVPDMKALRDAVGPDRCLGFHGRKKMSEPMKRGLYFGAGLVVGSVVWLAILRPILP